MTTHYGKFRGAVIGNADPMRMGRLLVTVPALDLLGAWAMPCFPVSGDKTGTWMIPSPGTGVWVEFEQGDVNYPIWSGCWYSSDAEVPLLASEASPALPLILFQTPSNTFMLSDAPGPAGGILLKTASGGFISISDEGMTLSNGKGASITLRGPSVTVNDGALEVI